MYMIDWLCIWSIDYIYDQLIMIKIDRLIMFTIDWLYLRSIDYVYDRSIDYVYDQLITFTIDRFSTEANVVQPSAQQPPRAQEKPGDQHLRPEEQKLLDYHTECVSSLQRFQRQWTLFSISCYHYHHYNYVSLGFSATTEGFKLAQRVEFLRTTVKAKVSCSKPSLHRHKAPLAAGAV